MPLDAIYSLTKHAVVGFVRSVAPLLAPIRINAVCPGIADTPMLDQPVSGQRFAAAGFPLLQPDDVAEAMWRAATSEGDGGVLVRAAGPRAGAVPLRELPGRRGVDGRAAVGACRPV